MLVSCRERKRSAVTAGHGEHLQLCLLRCRLPPADIIALLHHHQSPRYIHVRGLSMPVSEYLSKTLTRSVRLYVELHTYSNTYTDIKWSCRLNNFQLYTSKLKSCLFAKRDSCKHLYCLHCVITVQYSNYSFSASQSSGLRDI